MDKTKLMEWPTFDLHPYRKDAYQEAVVPNDEHLYDFDIDPALLDIQHAPKKHRSCVGSAEWSDLVDRSCEDQALQLYQSFLHSSF